MNNSPSSMLVVNGNIARSWSELGAEVEWSIYAEVESEGRARTRISVDGRIVADITIHAAAGQNLTDEVQAVSAALVWSAIRSVRLARAAPMEET